MKRIAMVAALAASAGVAGAANVTVPLGQSLSMNETLFFSADWQAALDTGRMAVSSYSPGVVSASKDADGFYVGIKATTPLTQLTMDQNMSTVHSATGVGGFTVTAPFLKSVSSGGSLTITDMSADLDNKVIYATMIGANGVGKLSNVAVWTFDRVTPSNSIAAAGWASCQLRPPSYDCMDQPYVEVRTTDLSGLRITTQAQATLMKSLGLGTLGRAAIVGIEDYGVLQIGSVPEPSTYALMGLGLVGISLLARRRSL